MLFTPSFAGISERVFTNGEHLAVGEFHNMLYSARSIRTVEYPHYSS
jgi:hypothetical protein